MTTTTDPFLGALQDLGGLRAFIERHTSAKNHVQGFGLTMCTALENHVRMLQVRREAAQAVQAARSVTDALRGAMNAPDPAGTGRGPREVIAAGRRALAKHYHPDGGGDDERMKRLNAAADSLEASVANVLRDGGLVENIIPQTKPRENEKLWDVWAQQSCLVAN